MACVFNKQEDDCLSHLGSCGPNKGSMEGDLTLAPGCKELGLIFP